MYILLGHRDTSRPVKIVKFVIRKGEPDLQVQRRKNDLIDSMNYTVASNTIR